MRRTCIILMIFTLLTVTACSVKKMDTEKIRDIEFTVMDKEDIPEELKVEIEEAKDGEMKLSYGDNGYLYVARGYGVQDTSGYSVEVSQCYEAEDAVVVKTDLLGPSREEEILKKKTCPYVVIKMEYTDKQVAFE